MADKVRWGVLSVANIGVAKVVPAMRESRWSEVVAIASRDIDRAKAAAGELGIPRAYGSYEELLADKDVEAIYNPLPNHMHLDWSVRAALAGKHVLCEKPLCMNLQEARALRDAGRRSGVKIEEAFMVRTHPQWIAIRDLVRGGRIGTVRSIYGYFSFFNRDPNNIRNVPQYGGGGLLDIGCYLVNTARFIFESEPVRVVGAIDRDPELGIDRLTSFILEFPGGHAIGTCSIQAVAHQRVNIVGTKARIEIEIPFNAPSDRPCRFRIDDGSSLFGEGIEANESPIANQYSIQADLFSMAVRGVAELPMPLDDSLRNMAVIDAIFRSARTAKWEAPEAISG